jgi:hypothetical protein
VSLIIKEEKRNKGLSSEGYERLALPVVRGYHLIGISYSQVKLNQAQITIITNLTH